MSRLQWNSVTARFFEAGLDRGVLFAPDGSVVPWNGLISINETSSSEFGAPVYLDGRLVYQDQLPGNYTATLTAFTFPDEFLEVTGMEEAKDGVFLGQQLTGNTFGLSWRTIIGNGGESNVAYKLHILFNATAIPVAIARKTLTDEVDPINFSWEIHATPMDVAGFRPTAYVVIDSRKIDKRRLESIERRLYGGVNSEATLGTLAELMGYIENDVLIRITDNGDGTWTAEGPDELITTYGTDWFRIADVNATNINSTTYTITTTEY